MKVLMAVLSLAGITGMYLRQVKQTGVLGLIGYLALARRLPAHAEHRSHRPWSSSRSIAGSSPGYVNDVLAVAVRRPRRPATSA